ncbi:helix-loop-helix protein delilah [Anastrepha obliqua]|uniref:helix-loop-helix protein delilah n=1 Tax=Anastrepha obliqua TaxID=95512 RepID=UPI00240A4006|nr:helix-loop-helix protein delilah [Anastrepha obliqua]XP_054743040.1 helix-loop-helix protein delilah [Anastrepha obliqua]XP_054743049.1 helix-loop-helix protein delilah [Anastrepha obliqua]XP_054743057.1 helix-loop-helix protein delilah [Anastrepha obliqua]
MKLPSPYKMHDCSSLLAGSQRSAEECKSSKVGSRKEKYSLRERQKRRLGLASVVDLPKRSNHKDDIEETTGPQRTQNTTMSKSKAPPLSKYRRKTANARERTRMREINSAFENLRHCVPPSIAVDETGPTNEKLTKITTLRLAMKYINLLSEVLNTPNFKGELPFDFLCASDETTIKQKPAPKALKVESSKSTAAMLKSTKPTNKATTGRTTVSAPVHKSPKRLGKRKKKELKSPSTAALGSSSNTMPDSCRANLSNTSTTSSFVTCSGDSLSSHSSSFLDSITSPSYSSSFVPSMSELNSLTLESDGESLHLSDPCHSPLQDKFDSIFGGSALDSRPTVEHNILGDIDAPLELSLQFLGTTPESLDFSMEQPPTTCISPLVSLDTFNPFSDFLHPEYPEHASLDMFLT